MKTVILIFAGATAGAILNPAQAQTISQPSGCVAGVPCQAATLAIGGATLGSNVFAATGDAQVTGQFVAFSNITTGAATRLQFSGRSALSSPADGQLTVSNNGSTNSFTVTAGASGLATFGAGMTVTGVASVGSLSSGGNVRATTDAGLVTIGAANDAILSRKAAGTIQHGDADAAFPVAQTITAQSVVAGTSNTAAPNLTIDAPRGTGTGPGGSFIVRVAPAGSTGSAQNAMSMALTIDSTKLATFAAGVSTGGTISASSGGVTVPGNITTTSGNFIGNYFFATPHPVAGLLSCSGNDGARSFVTDATTTTFAAAVTGGGSNHVPVYCDGAGTPTWKVG